MKPAMPNASTTLSSNPQLHAFYKRMDTLVTQQPALSEMSQFYRAALPVVWAAQQRVEPFMLAPAVVHQKLQAGVPLLVGEELPLDEAQTEGQEQMRSKQQDKQRRPPDPVADGLKGGLERSHSCLQGQ